MLLFTFTTIDELEFTTTPALIVIGAFVVCISTCPPVRLSVAVPAPAVFAKTRGRFDTGVGAVPGRDPIGNATTAGPIKIEPPPVDTAAEALSGKLIVSPAGN